MRIDHHAYQRATRVAGFGLLLQAAIGLLLLIFGWISNDNVFLLVTPYALIGVLVWLGLVIIFHQHKLERLESLEEDELAAGRGAAESFFERTGDETRAAARRLGLMHKWLMPGLSLFIALLLAGIAVPQWRFMRAVATNFSDFSLTEERGWSVAICLSAAAVCFIFSRFVAGMAKLEAWQNLRGGAAYMVGNALVLVAVAVGIIFRFFENEQVIRGVAWAVPIFHWAFAAEIILNFILNLYRPRIPGDVPRPAFDSKVLSLLAAPDNIVRSLNEAVNYQFGFDVTSSWGYQLLLRSVASLVALGVIVLILLSTMVIVEPHQQAVRLRGGAIVGNQVHESGVLWKLPWPLETAAVYDVGRVRSLHLTARVTADAPVNLWKEEPPATDVPIEPFIVGSPLYQAPATRRADVALASARSDATGGESGLPAATQPSEEDVAAQRVSESFSLVDAEIVLQYKIQPENNGLLDFLNFAPETYSRRQTSTDRERALRFIALSEVSSHLASMTLDEVLAPGRSSLAAALRDKVQRAFDTHRAGVQVVSIDLPMLRPSGVSAPTFEGLDVEVQNRLTTVALADRTVRLSFDHWLGSAAHRLEDILAGIDRFEQLQRELGADHPDTRAAAQAVEDILLLQDQVALEQKKQLIAAGKNPDDNQTFGEAVKIIQQAEGDRWVQLIAQQIQARRVHAKKATYEASPYLYFQRELMSVFKERLPLLRKYVIAVDPSKVSVDMNLEEVDPILQFSGASEEEEAKSR